MPKGKKGFQRGTSGNPGGRPKELAGLVARCKKWVDDKGIAYLISIAENTSDPKIQMAAIIYLTDRGYGKSTERHEVTGADGEPLKIDWANEAINNPELSADISKLMGKIAKK